ncbi:MAG: hypothetical protein PWP37_1259 [Thermotogota bacterium]|nr:hypothetical protein [Thermotogota bacterium]HCZ06595.1 hypothetical protein [Thermotogota bacterium]
MEASELNSDRVLFKNANVFDPYTGNWKKKDLYVESGIVRPSFCCKEPQEVVDLKYSWVIPGFTDSHCHLIGLGSKLRSLDLSRYNDLEGMFSEIKAWIDKDKDDKRDFYLFRGWDDQRLGRSPTKHDIKKWLGENVKIVLVRYCGHVGVASESLCRKFGITDPDGMVSEDELNGILDSFPRTKTELKQDFIEGVKEALKYGVTCVHSEDYHRCGLNDLIELLKDQTMIRVFEKLHLNLDEIHGLKNIFGVLSSFSTVGSVKLYIDGSLGGRTAYLSEAYEDAPTKGRLNITPKELEKYALLANKLGVQLSLHAIGDAALDVALNTLWKYPQRVKSRLIHLQVTRKDQLEKLPHLNAHFSVQPHFWASDLEMAKKRIGKRMKTSYAFRKMYMWGARRMSFSSDAPVEPVDPRFAIESAMKMGFSWEESVALHTMTAAEVAGPYFSKRLGRLEPGYLADFVVYEKDPRSLPEPSMVFVNGKIPTLIKGGDRSVGSR